MNRDLMTSLATMAWRNLRRNKRRNAATSIAITAGFTAFLLAAGYAMRAHNVLSHYTIYALRTGHISIVRKGALEMYTIKPKQWSIAPSDQQRIELALKSVVGIEKFGPTLTGQGIIGNGCKSFPFIATGVDLGTERFTMTHPRLLKWASHLGAQKYGKPLWEFTEQDSPLALSTGLAKLLGKTKVHGDIPAGSPMNVLNCLSPDVTRHFADDANVQLAGGTWDGQMNAIDGEMVQQFSTGLIETNNASVTLSIKKLQELYNTQNVSAYSIWLQDPNELSAVLAKVRAAFAATPDDFEILPWRDERISPYYTGTIRFISTMVSFIGAVLALVIILSIFNSATMTVIERSEEVGMLRSLGYTRARIQQIFALEGLFITLLSTLTGIIVSLIAMEIIYASNIRFTPPGIDGGMQLIIIPDIRIMLIATACVSSLGMLATWLAVTGISKKNIAELVAGTHR